MLAISQTHQHIFQVWKTVKLGNFQSTDKLRKSLKTNGCQVSSQANDALGRIAVSNTEIEIGLIKVTVTDLGFKEGAKRENIYRSAKELGLDVCVPEVGPQLRLQYTNQPKNDWLLIGMKPIDMRVGPIAFSIGNEDNSCWLSTRCGRPDSFWLPSCQWVFMQCR